MRKFLSLIVVLMLASNVKAQGLAITEAADFTFSDNGTEKTLFEILDGGQHALLFFLNYQSTSDDLAAIINGVYSNLGKNQDDVYMIGIDHANESTLLNQWAHLTEIEFPLVAKDQSAYSISQTYGGITGVFTPALVLIAPKHDIILEEIWPINSVEQVVGIINDNLVKGDDNTGNEGGDDNTGNEGGDDNTGNEGGDDNTGDEGGDDNTGNEGGDDNEEPVKPEIPNVVATTTETTVTLTWDAIEGATSYNIYTPKSFDSDVLGLEDTTYTFEGLTAGKRYCFEVSAVYPTDESDAFEVCATTKTEGEDDGEDPEYPEPTTVPAAPVINVYAENSGLIVIEWEAVETAIFYYVYHKGNLVGDGQVMGTEVEIKVYPETEYCFTVTAVNTVGESEHSEEDCATTPAEGEDPINPDSNIEVAENDFVIYPNPVNDKLYIETETEVKEVVVYDIFGRQQDLSDISGQQSVINVANLNSGVYFVKVVTENGEVVKRFVKK